MRRPCRVGSVIVPWIALAAALSAAEAPAALQLEDACAFVNDSDKPIGLENVDEAPVLGYLLARP